MLITFLSFSLYACSYQTHLGPPELPTGAFVHPSFVALRSKANVSNQVYLVEELPHQVILVVHSLGQLVDHKIEVYLTSLTGMRELCGELCGAQFTRARVSLEVHIGAYVEHRGK